MSDAFPPDNQEEPAPEPELIDWWVWGVRQAAALIGGILLSLRGIVVLYVLLRAGVWYLTREPVAPRDVGIALAALLAAWGLGPLLARFSVAQDSPDPTRRRRFTRKE
ncbi:MAG: hypothetical protein U0031_03430 [Thermomicrobiales bacterium]